MTRPCGSLLERVFACTISSQPTGIRLLLLKTLLYQMRQVSRKQQAETRHPQLLMSRDISGLNCVTSKSDTSGNTETDGRDLPSKTTAPKLGPLASRARRKNTLLTANLVPISKEGFFRLGPILSSRGDPSTEALCPADSWQSIRKLGQSSGPFGSTADTEPTETTGSITDNNLSRTQGVSEIIPGKLFVGSLSGLLHKDLLARPTLASKNKGSGKSGCIYIRGKNFREGLLQVFHVMP